MNHLRRTKRRKQQLTDTRIAPASYYSGRGAPGVKAADGETRRRGAPWSRAVALSHSGDCPNQISQKKREAEGGGHGEAAHHFPLLHTPSPLQRCEAPGGGGGAAGPQCRRLLFLSRSTSLFLLVFSFSRPPPCPPFLPWPPSPSSSPSPSPSSPSPSPYSAPPAGGGRREPLKSMPARNRLSVPRLFSPVWVSLM